MFEEIPALSILSFFDLSIKCHYVDSHVNALTAKKYKLPSMTKYLNEEEFASVSIGYNEEKIMVHLEVNKQFEEYNANDFRKGDSLELFFDTRDLKDKDIISQFHHHFIFSILDANQSFGKEVTKFRTNEMHTICDPSALKVQGYYGAKSYRLDIEIPSSVLHGYNPGSFDRLGFTYRINRKGGTPQHFSVSSFEYKIELHPSLWASLVLEK